MAFYGIECLLFERVDDVRKVQGGSGLRLGYNAGRAFKHLGLLDQLLQVSSALDNGVRFETSKGNYLGTTKHVEGEAHVGIRRGSLHELLLGAIDRSRMHTGAEFVRFEQDDSGVTAHLADGSTARGDILIGADGLKSKVREEIHGPTELRYAGYAARRGVLETDSNGQMRVILGRGLRFAYFPVGEKWVYWSASTNDPEGVKEEPAELKRTVLERFEGFPEPVESFVAETKDEQTFHADTYDRDPLKSWGEGRVTLLGDAAHPMTWDRGQGACQAIEGALFLAQHLAENGDDKVAALRAWEAERIPRTKKIVLGSRRMGKLCQADKGPMRLARNQVLRLMTSIGAKKESSDYLVEYA